MDGVTGSAYLCVPAYAHASIEPQTDAIIEHNSHGSIILSSSTDMQREFNVMEDTV